MVKGAGRLLVVVAVRVYYCSHSERVGLVVAFVSVGQTADFRPWLLDARSRLVVLSPKFRGRLNFEQRRRQHQGR